MNLRILLAVLLLIGGASYSAADEPITCTGAINISDAFLEGRNYGIAIKQQSKGRSIETQMLRRIAYDVPAPSPFVARMRLQLHSMYGAMQSGSVELTEQYLARIRNASSAWISDAKKSPDLEGALTAAHLAEIYAVATLYARVVRSSPDVAKLEEVLKRFDEFGRVFRRSGLSSCALRTEVLLKSAVRAYEAE